MPERTEFTPPADLRDKGIMPPELKQRLYTASYRLKGKKGYELASEAERMVQDGILQTTEHRHGTGREIMYFVSSPNNPENVPGSLPKRYDILWDNYAPDFHRGKGEVHLGFSTWSYDSEGRLVQSSHENEEVSYSYHDNGKRKRKEVNDKSRRIHEVREYDEKGRSISEVRTSTEKGFVLTTRKSEYGDDGSSTETYDRNNEFDGKPDTRDISSTKPDRTHIDTRQFFNPQGQLEREEIGYYEDGTNDNHLSRKEARYFDETGAVTRTE